MDRRTLARIGRVRALQLTLAQGDEARAREKAASEAALNERIAALAAAVAPRETTSTALMLGATAHFRQRLHTSAQTATDRVVAAEHQLVRATAATLAARQDQTAVEKLAERARRVALAAEMRALEDAPGTTRKRHDPC